MATIKLPLDKTVISIGHKNENGPRPQAGLTPLYLDYDTFDGPSLRRIAPDEVVSWLFCEAYDAYDVAHLLVTSGFLGRYVAVAPELRNPKVVTREIRRCFPGLDFVLVCPSALSRKASEYVEFITSATARAELAPA